MVGLWVLPCWWVGEAVVGGVCMCVESEYCNVVVIVGSFDRMRSPTNVIIMKDLDQDPNPTRSEISKS